MEPTTLKEIDRANALIAEATALSDCLAESKPLTLDDKTVATVGAMLRERLQSLGEIIQVLHSDIRNHSQ